LARHAQRLAGDPRRAARRGRASAGGAVVGRGLADLEADAGAQVLEVEGGLALLAGQLFELAAPAAAVEELPGQADAGRPGRVERVAEIVELAHLAAPAAGELDLRLAFGGGHGAPLVVDLELQLEIVDLGARREAAGDQLVDRGRLARLAGDRHQVE